MSFTISQLILYWLMQEFISAHSSSNKFWGNVVCMKMGAWLEQYDTHVTWPSLAPNVLPKFSWSTYIYIYIYSQWSKYIHNVCEKSCIWVPHPFCQKCHVISFSQQFIKVFILYDWSHNDFKCFYYSARGRQTCTLMYTACAITQLMSTYNTVKTFGLLQPYITNFNATNLILNQSVVEKLLPLLN